MRVGGLMREYASVLAKGGLVSITLGSDAGGDDNELSRHFAEIYHNSLYKVYGQNIADNPGFRAGDASRVRSLQKKSADADTVQTCAVRVMARIDADKFGVPRCRISVQKVPPKATVQTCNCALEVARDFYEYAKLSRDYMGSYGDKVKKLLDERMKITLDTSLLMGR